MVTGIETAGLALAIFPLVIEGLKSYSNGARTIKDMWRSQVTLKSLIRELRMEKCKFENTLTSLLEGVVLDQSDLSDLDSKLWYTEDFQNTLKSRLRPDTVEVYIDAMENLYSALESLTNKFALGSEHESDDQRALKRKWKMIRLVLSKEEYKEQLNQISKTNSDLQLLTGQANVSDASFSSAAVAQATASVKNYKHVRDHAMTLYGVLKEKLQPVAPFCQCSTPHYANLQLEMRDVTFRQKRFGKNAPIRFRIMISFEGAAGAGTPLLRSWRNLKLEPVDSSRTYREFLEGEQTGRIDISRSGGAMGLDFHAHMNTESKVGVNSLFQEDEMLRKTSSIPEPPNPIQRARGSTKALLRSSLQVPRSESRPTTPRKVSFNDLSAPQTPVTFREPTSRIEHLCLIMQQAESCQSCLGVLADKSQQYLVWPLISPSPPGSTELISLRNLLDDDKMLGKEDRLILGVQLASTVLQLHKTEWLSEDWSNKDIFFHPIDTEGRKPDIKRPFVRQSSLQPTQDMQQTTQYALIPHDQSLFSLGIVLMELWYGCPLEKLQKEEDGPGSIDVFIANLLTARRLASNISSEAGAKYGEAVRRCINGLDYGSGSLDADDLKRKAHMEVVTPLVESLEFFCGKNIGKIFPVSA